MDDVRAVMDAVGSERAALVRHLRGRADVPAVRRDLPRADDRARHIGAYARRLWAPDYPWGTPPSSTRRSSRRSQRDWGGPVGLDARAPSQVDDPAFSALVGDATCA